MLNPINDAPIKKNTLYDYPLFSLIFRKESLSWRATGTDGAVPIFLFSAAALHFLFTSGCGAQFGF